MNYLRNLRIRSKALILVAASVVTAVAMFLVAYQGLSSIKGLLDSMLLATNVERYAFSTILEEKNYLLNSNGATLNDDLAAGAFRNAERDVKTILETLDKIDVTVSSGSLRDRSRAAREGTNAYADLYRKGVAALTSLEALTRSLEQDGETATQQARDFIGTTTDPGHKLIAFDIREGTYLIRANEKRYMLTQKSEIFEEMKKDFAVMMARLATLESQAADATEKQQIQAFKQAALNYEKSAYKWVDNRNTLFNEILPQMNDLGGKVIKLAYAAAQESAETMGAARQSVIVWLIVIGTGIAAVGMLLGLVVSRALTGPVSGLTSAMERLAKGDRTVEVPSTEQKDEIGEMARSVQVFKDGQIAADRQATEQDAERAVKERRTARLGELTRAFEGKAEELVNEVSAAAISMEATAQSMATIVEETTRQATTVASASGHASANVQTVAAATEELASSISEISRQVADSARIARRARDDAKQTDDVVQALAASANKIGEVVGLISNIAGQTNLLALNATIEAARAGDAGKGFAVVASEVKSLATQTAKATADIGTQVEQIQSATRQAVESIQNIGKTIGEISAISSSIAAAVEQQGSATNEIARNVQQAAIGTQDVTTNIDQVSDGANSTGTASGEVLRAAGQLSAQADRLRGEVAQYIAGVKAA